MVLKALELRHFRNLAVQGLNFPSEGVAVVGDNAQGKTSLLEAIYYLESFRSFRGASDSDLVAFSDDVFHLRGTVEGDVPTTVAAGFDRRRKSKKVTVDGGDAARISSALGRLGAVVFSLADTDLVTGGPGVRRRFLDIVLSLNRPGYVDALQEYRKWLAQRNAALRTARGRASRAQAGAWERGLVRAGATVTRIRRDWTSEWAPTFAHRYAAISHGDEAALTYRANVEPPAAAAPPAAEPAAAGSAATATGPAEPAVAEAAIRERFADRLDERWEHDARRGATSVGPHRDDLSLTVSTGEDRRLPLRSHGSGGQRRTAALALRLTEAATIRRHRRTEPILLLDDAFAELDPGRAERVMGLLDDIAGQVILTVPKESDARLPGRVLPQWRIRAGVVEA